MTEVNTSAPLNFALIVASYQHACGNIPPAAELASLTPATAPAALAPVFAQGFGSPNLVTNTYRLQLPARCAGRS